MSEANRQDDPDRLLWRRYASPTARAAAGECPDELDLAAWLDGRAEPPLAERIEAHLAGCRDCLQAAADLRAMLAASPTAAAPQVIRRAKALAARLARRPAKLWVRLGRWAAAAAAAVLVSYAGFAAGSATRHSHQAVEAAVVHEATFGLEDGRYDEPLDDELFALMEVQP